LLLTKADCIITLSNGMANLLSKYVNKSKIKVIPNWGSNFEEVKLMQLLFPHDVYSLYYQSTSQQIYLPNDVVLF